LFKFSELTIGIGIRTPYKNAVFYRGKVALAYEEMAGNFDVA
jgi:hypothetical protein